MILMTERDYFYQMLLEYMLNTYNRYELDYLNVKNSIDYHGLDADSYYRLLVCEIRLDCLSSEFRKIRQLIDTYRKS